MTELSPTESALLAMQDSAERFEAFTADTGTRSEEFQRECRVLTEEIEALKHKSIFDK